VLGAEGARVLVVGTGAGDAPAALGRVLTARCGLAQENLRVIVEPASPLEFGEAVADAAEQAVDALVVYYQGTITTDGDGAVQLATAVSDVRPHRLPHTWLPLSSVLAAVAASPAAHRLVVVDAVGLPPARPGSGAAAVSPAAATSPGAIVVPAAVAEEAGPDVDVAVTVSARAPRAGEQGAGEQAAPALSDVLVHLLMNGDPDGPVELSVGQLLRSAGRRLALGGQAMARSAAAWSDRGILAVNVAHTPPIAHLEAAPTALLPDGPGPVVTPTPRPASAPPTGSTGSSPGAAVSPSAVPAARSGAPTGDGGLAGDVCPYPGLASFDGETRQWFFGRERAIADALSRLEDRLGGAGPLVLVGASGSGKSSLLRAGLLPALRRGAVAGARGWPQVLMTPTDHPARELAGQLAAAAGLSVLAAARLDVVAEPERFVGALADLLALRPAGAGGAGTAAAAGRRVLIVVDQFEETFTLCADERERTAFIRALVAAARGDGARGDGAPAGMITPPAVVVLGVRADFYGGCAAHPELVDALQRGQVVVGPMTAAEVRDAVVRPAEAVGLAVEPGLVDLMIHDLGAAEHGVVADPGSLPLLAHALRATWQEREGTALTVAGYLRVGGLRGAIARTAEETFGALDAAGQDLAWQIMLRLVRFGDGTDDTRRRVPRAELLALSAPDGAGESGGAGGADAARVLDALVGARLLTADADSVEISHEALLRSWPRLREWIEVDRAAAVARQRLADAAATWETGGRDPSYLFTGTRLAAARESTEHEPSGAAPTPVARDFLAASLAAEAFAARVEARRTRRLRQLVAALTALVLVACGTMAFAFWQRSQVADERDEARSVAIGRQAAQLRAADPLAAAQLAATAYRIAPTPEARSALLSTFASGYGFATRHLGSQNRPIGAVAYSRDGRLVAAASDDWSVALWDAAHPARRTPLATIRGHRLAVKSVAFSPDGRYLATGSDDRTVRLWTLTDPTHPTPAATLTGATDSVYGLAFTPDGRTLATGGFGTQVRLWNVADVGAIRQIGTVTAHTANVRALAYSADGTELLTGGDDGRALLWDVRDPAAPAPLAALTSQVGDNVTLSASSSLRSVALSPDGRIAVTGSDDTTARVYDVSDPRHPTVVQVIDRTRPVTSVAANAAGLVAIAVSNTVEVYDPTHHGDIVALLPHGSKPWSIAFSPDGRTLATGADDRALRLWDVPGATVVGATRFLWSTAVAPNGRLVATGDYANTVRLWDTTDPARPQAGAVLPGLNAAVDNVRFTPDGRVLVGASLDHTTGFDATVILWDVADPRHPRVLTTLHPGIGAVNDLKISPDGRTLAMAGDSARVALWDITDRAAPRQRATIAGHRYDASTVAFSPDGRTLASGSSDRTVRLWDITSLDRPAALATIVGFTSALITVTFSRDGNTLAAGSFDPRIARLDVRDRRAPRELTPLTGLGAGVNDIQYSADGRLMAAAIGGSDGVVRLWDVTGGGDPKPYATFAGRYNGFAAVAFAPDGSYLVGTPYQVVGFVWGLDPRRAESALCARAGDPLTRAEWKQYLPDLAYDPPCR